MTRSVAPALLVGKVIRWPPAVALVRLAALASAEDQASSPETTSTPRGYRRW